MIKTQEVKEIRVMQENEEIICWDDEECWEIKTKGIELHGDFSIDVDSGILIIRPIIIGAKLSVEISNDGYLSIMQLAQMGE